ncbi:MAG: NAD-dependent epimerase/dehydratase family protein [Opitutales bacterium]
MSRRVAVTGGSGTIGSHVLRELLDHDCEVWNFDRVRPAVALTRTVLVDTTDFGDLVSCLAGFDAVVHLAAISSPRHVSNNRTFRTNAQSDFNVLEAAAHLHINRVVLASSLNAVGMTYNLQPCVEYLPLDEEHPCRPDEAYGLSKLVAETLGHGFARRYPEMTISSLRFPMVMTPEAYRTFKLNEEYLRKILWTYADVREAARAVRLASEATWRGHEVFLIAADHTVAESPSSELVARWYPNVPLKAELSGRMALVSARKAERLLGWRHERTFAASLAEFRG